MAGAGEIAASGGALWMYGFLLLAGAGATAPWRMLGVLLSTNLDLDSEVLRWVRAVSTALIAGLVARMVLLPVGALAGVPLWLRCAAFAVALAVFFAARRHLATGIAAGTVVLVLGQHLIGG